MRSSGLCCRPKLNGVYAWRPVRTQVFAGRIPRSPPEALLTGTGRALNTGTHWRSGSGCLPARSGRRCVAYT